MRVTKTQLRRIIREAINEQSTRMKWGTQQPHWDKRPKGYSETHVDMNRSAMDHPNQYPTDDYSRVHNRQAVIRALLPDHARVFSTNPDMSFDLFDEDLPPKVAAMRDLEMHDDDNLLDVANDYGVLDDLARAGHIS
jgi:hypothetical protein